ncbi:MAG: MATE family efflux transporter [Oscillochloris sp.]|nr:MATE family efflux transporter [Oscillochloris sp.]
MAASSHIDRLATQGSAQPSTRSKVFKLALPAVGEQLLNTLVGMADIYLVGNLSLAAITLLGYDSAAALTAVGLGNQMTWVAMVLFMAVGVGATALVARAVGADDRRTKARVVHQSLMLAVVVGLLAMLGGIFGAGSFLRLLNAPAESFLAATHYMQITAAAFVPTALLLVGTALLRGAGDTRTPLLVMLGINAANIAISWLLVNGQFGLPALGVEGAAVGTAVARGVGGIFLLGLLLRGHSGLKLAVNLRIDHDMARRLARIGLPTGIEQMIFQSALLIFVRFVTDQGAASYAAHNIAITIESLSFLPGLGYAAACSALVGQALGARDPNEAEDAALEALWQGGLMMTLIGATMVIFPEAWIRIFVSDPEIIAAAIDPLRAAGLVQPALAVSFICLGCLRGAGDTRWPMFSRILTTWVVRLPLTVLLVSWLGLGLPGVWLAMCTDFTLQAILSLYRFNSRRWQQIKV